MTQIDLSGVDRFYPSDQGTVRAVHGVHLSIPTGSYVGVYGVSGSGKSTLLNLIAGLDQATQGTVLVGDHNLGLLTEDQRSHFRLRHIGVVFQEHNLLEEFTAVENVMLPLEVLGLKPRTVYAAAIGSLTQVGMEDFADRHPSQLSGGQRQRVGIARAITGDRDLLVADEPSGSLDSRASNELFGMFRSLAESGTTVVVATHDPLVRNHADLLYEIIDGRINHDEPVRQ